MPHDHNSVSHDLNGPTLNVYQRLAGLLSILSAFDVVVLNRLPEQTAAGSETAQYPVL